MFSGLASAFERIELFETGGAASRPLFADFLEEASLILNKPALSEAAKHILNLATHWTALSEVLLPDDEPLFRETRQLLLEKRDLFWEQVSAALDKIKAIQARLNTIRTTMEIDFPLSDIEILKMKENLSEHVLQIHNAKKNAITTLEKAFVL